MTATPKEETGHSRTYVKRLTMEELNAHITELQVKVQSYYRALEGHKALKNELKKNLRFLATGQTASALKEFPDGTTIKYVMARE